MPVSFLGVWRAVTTALHLPAIASTIFRLYYRHHTRHLWWEDYYAGAALVVDLVYIPVPWLRWDFSSTTSSAIKQRIMAYWIGALLPHLVVWFARISIGMSIARLVPPQTRARYLLYAMNGLFALMCAGHLLHKIVKCTMDTSWHHTASVQCYPGSELGIITLCTDIVVDAFLVTIPLRMLWRIKLPRSQRRLILLIFASSVISTLIGIVYTAFSFGMPLPGSDLWGFWISLVLNTKAAVTLFVCNLLVIVMFLYRVFWKDGDDDVSEPSETRDPPTHPLPPTTILKLTEISPARTTDTKSRSSGSFIFMHSDPWSSPTHMKEHKRNLTL